MRRAQDQIWLEEPDSPFYGICLGADFVAEHEHGIGDMKKDLGIPEHDISVYGIDKRRITKVNEAFVHFYKEGDTSMFLYARYLTDMPATLSEAQKRIRELSISNTKLNIGTAWDERGFGIIVKGLRNQTCLEELHVAFLQKRVALWFGGGQVAFGNPGLCVGIVDAIPPEHLKTLYESDKKHHQLIQESDRIGIKQRIDELNRISCEGRKYGSMLDAPFGYYALSPSWLKGGTHNGRTSQYKVMYWLNPMNQQKVNFGWFTVEDLEHWLEGRGPIPMTQQQMKKKNSR